MPQQLINVHLADTKANACTKTVAELHVPYLNLNISDPQNPSNKTLL